ncbi:unnamed protein product [Acanthoscelides obtectus]|uniref:Suppressor of white apricot N-terminal domain-containing protein n=2 Tax=Acanthoscelides obtectus TaxID=200917 RepID=A0A9P0PZB6_ACAOB|nr:unnamed protein product [Acanthoscelides obtectus]CAK1674173.1 CLK4-associating serine/arginine rich protein [Acanthoscelides obtectus]
MWHEARRQERKIRGMLVDYRRRAERRRDFYEKIKADPTQFLQVHGRQCKIHLDPQVAAAADSAVMMPWQGNSDTLIDRFDGRAHLDYIPPLKKEEETELSQEERQLNYERYRIIAQNSFLGISEEKFLKQLQLEEQFGYTEHHQKGKKEQKTGGVAIGFNYDEGTAPAPLPEQPDSDHVAEDSDSDADCSDLDVDLSVNVSKMDAAQAHDMNKHGRQFGMHSNDFYSFLTDDMEEAENRRLAREEEQEKALYAGRKSRRERRYHREKRLANRVLSPPSYAARESPTIPTSLRESKSASRSPSPDNAGKITFITSFGGEEETPSSSKPTTATYADKVKSNLKARSRSSERAVYRRRSRSRSDSKRRRSRSGSRIRSRKSRSRSVSKGKRARRSKSPFRRRSRSDSNSSRSRSVSVVKRRSRSRSYSRDRKLHSKSSRGSTNRNYNRQPRSSSDSSSSSSSSSRATSPLKRKSYSSSPVKESPNKSRQTQQEDNKMEVDEPPKVLPRYYGRKRSDVSSSEDEDDEGNQSNGEQQKGQSVKSDNSVMGHGNSSGIGTKVKNLSKYDHHRTVEKKKTGVVK